MKRHRGSDPAAIGGTHMCKERVVALDLEFPTTIQTLEHFRIVHNADQRSHQVPLDQAVGVWLCCAASCCSPVEMTENGGWQMRESGCEEGRTNLARLCAARIFPILFCWRYCCCTSASTGGSMVRKKCSWDLRLVSLILTFRSMVRVGCKLGWDAVDVRRRSLRCRRCNSVAKNPATV